MYMIWQDHYGINYKRVPPTRVFNGDAESIHAIDEQRVTTLKKIDREKPAPSGYECATVAGHHSR
jgi:hypothetical protein